MNFHNTLKEYKGIINKELELFLKNNDSLDYSSVKEFVLNGGKRLRPIAFIMAYKSVKNNNEKKIFIPSLSVELVHNSTLVHDDVMDEDELRRNKPTVYKNSKEWFLKNYKDVNYRGALFNNVSSRFAVSNAIICGNVLLSLGFKTLIGFQHPKINEAIDILNNSYKTVVDGQIMDLMTEFNKELAEKEYFEMISKKTAELFKASVKIGALLGDASEEQIKSLSDYAVEAAIAFQIKDDVMDISKDMNKGHELGSDIKQGKKNLLIIKALELAGEKDKRRILKILGDENASSDKINSVVEVIKSTGAVSYAEKLAKLKIMIAKNCLKKAEINKESFSFFSKLADYMAERKT